jgi:hypothetical protein
MNLFRSALMLAVAASLAAIWAGAAAAGGDAGPPLYPSAVNVQMVGTEKQLDKAATYEDEGDTAKAVKALTAARSHMRKAWLAAKYIIDHAPPPVAGDGSVAHVKVVQAKTVKRATKVRAHSSGGAVPGASPFADQYTTAVGVLTMQHDVVASMLGLIENADATLLPVVSSTLFAAMNDRDTAIAYIHTVAPPPVAGDGSVRARKSDGVVDFSTVMPGVTPYVNDEADTIDNLAARVKLSPGRKRVLDAAQVQAIKTARTLGTFFPAPVGD